MTAFGLFSQPFYPDNRTWLADDHGTEVAPGFALDLTKFNQSQHYPNGYIPSGTVIGLLTSGGKGAPYLAANSDGTQTAVGITLNPVSVYQPGTANLLTSVGVACLIHGFVYASKLPFTSGNAAAGGYLDTAAQTALKDIIFVPAVA